MSFYGNKKRKTGSKMMGYFSWANLTDISIDNRIASSQVWWPPSWRYTPLWTETWWGEHAPGSESLARLLLRPIGILLNVSFNCYWFFNKMLQNDHFVLFFVKKNSRQFHPRTLYIEWLHIEYCRMLYY